MLKFFLQRPSSCIEYSVSENLNTLNQLLKDNQKPDNLKLALENFINNEKTQLLKLSPPRTRSNALDRAQNLLSSMLRGNTLTVPQEIEPKSPMSPMSPMAAEVAAKETSKPKDEEEHTQTSSFSCK